MAAIIVENNISDQKFISWIPDLLYPIIDRLVERESQMLAKHLRSFTVGEDVLKALAENPGEIEDYYRCTVFMQKNAISQYTYKGTEFCFKEMEEKNKTRLPHESPHDGNPCLLAGKVGTLYWRGLYNQQGRESFNNFISPFVDKFQQIRSEEMDYFNNGTYLQFEPDSISSRHQLLEALLTSLGDKLGFSVNKKLTRPKKLVLTKPVFGNLEFFWGIDIGKIEHPVGPIQNDPSPEILQALNAMPAPLRPHSGPEFFMFFGILDKKKVKSLTMDNDYCFFLRFKNFFPIETGLNYWTSYRRFYNLKELEAVININLKLYEILLNDFGKVFI